MVSLVEVMRECFGLQTPLYSKPAMMTGTPPTSGAVGSSLSQPAYNSQPPISNSPHFSSASASASSSHQHYSHSVPGAGTNNQGFSEIDEERIRLESLKTAAQDKMVPHLLTLHEMMSRDVEKLLDENKTLIEGGNNLKSGLSSLTENIVRV